MTFLYNFNNYDAVCSSILQEVNPLEFQYLSVHT